MVDFGAIILAGGASWCIGHDKTMLRCSSQSFSGHAWQLLTDVGAMGFVILLNLNTPIDLYPWRRKVPPLEGRDHV